MPANNTHPAQIPASHRREATITDIGTALHRKRSRGVGTSLHDTAELPLTPPFRPPLHPGTIIGYFRHAGHCMQVQYASSGCLWLREQAGEDLPGALPAFEDYACLHYTEFGHIVWPHRTLQFTYAGKDTEPDWMPLPSASLADLLRKVLSLYDYVSNGIAMDAADNLVPNPAPEEYDPNRKPS